LTDCRLTAGGTRDTDIGFLLFQFDNFCGTVALIVLTSAGLTILGKPLT